jgi:hypothetical protein
LSLTSQGICATHVPIAVGWPSRQVAACVGWCLPAHSNSLICGTVTNHITSLTKASTRRHPSRAHHNDDQQRRRVEHEMADQITVKVLQTGIGGTGEHIQTSHRSFFHTHRLPTRTPTPGVCCSSTHEGTTRHPTPKRFPTLQLHDRGNPRAYPYCITHCDNVLTIAVSRDVGATTTTTTITTAATPGTARCSKRGQGNVGHDG